MDILPLNDPVKHQSDSSSTDDMKMCYEQIRNFYLLLVYVYRQMYGT